MLSLSVEWYKLLVLVPIVGMLILRTGGISFFFRLFMRIFKLSYDNHQLKKTESAAYDLQLFKALEGINVRSVSDAKFIRDEINSGRLQKRKFMFTYPIGYIGDEKKTWDFYSGIIGVILLCLAIALYSNHLASSYKIGYYRVDALGQSEYVSPSNITTKNEDVFLSKDTCNFILSHDFVFSIRKVSCSLFVRSQAGDKLWLTKQIEKSDLEYRVYYWGSAFYTLLFSYLSIGFFNFHRTNKKILKLKEQRQRAKER